MPCMSERSLVTFHTAPAEDPYYDYQKLPGYREIIGFSQNGSHLWTPRANGGETPHQLEEYDLDRVFAAKLGRFFGQWFEEPDLAWNCHMAAAGMQGLEGWHDQPTARRYAEAIVKEAEATAEGAAQYRLQEPRTLAEGQQGVYAVGPWRVEHSVVGLGRNAQGKEEHMQLAGTNERYASIVPVEYNHGLFLGNSPQTRLYGSKQG